VGGGVGSVVATSSGGGGSRLTQSWAVQRLAVVDAKLRGGNSAALTMRDLETSTNAAVKKAEVFESLRDVVMGPQGSLRRSMAESGLTADEQVDVLIEQATDPNVLGRTYQGWAPFL
jgi:DNA-dependent protein kinase catalytic subunit